MCSIVKIQIYTNVYVPHLSSAWQVTACVTDSSLLRKEVYPTDVCRRAREYLKATSGGCGAYTDSAGLPLVRQQVADFLQKRDGYEADAKSIQLTTGASEGVKRAISALIQELFKF